jgi:uncharacterized protein YgiM (DUF1202 family)
MRTRYTTIAAALLGAAWISLAAAQEAGVALKADEIKAEPFKDAKTVGTIDKGDAVSILSKQSGWLRIKAGTKQGWVRMLSVRRGAAGKSDAGKELAGISGVATGRTGTGQVVSATGVRGLSAEELKAAEFNEEEVKRAEASAVPASDAQQFAKAGKLAARTVAFLPEPKGGQK